MQFKLKDPLAFLGTMEHNEMRERFTTVYIHAEGYDAAFTTLQQVLTLPHVKLCDANGDHICDLLTNHFVQCFAHVAGTTLTPLKVYSVHQLEEGYALKEGDKIVYMHLSKVHLQLVADGIKIGCAASGEPVKFLGFGE